MVTRRDGFTLIEVVIAILLLSFGVLAIAGSSGRMMRMFGRGTRSATAAVYAQEQLEILRATPCANLTSSNTTRELIYDLTWNVTAMAGGNIQRVQLIVSYPGEATARADTVETQIACVI